MKKYQAEAGNQNHRSLGLEFKTKKNYRGHTIKTREEEYK